jgi:RND superfamily putative drug exporter
MQTRNLAERAGRWSARHRRVAVLGWLAVVIVSVMLGSAIGTEHIADEDLGNGESRAADQVLADGGFADRATEQVLVQDEDGRLTFASPRFRAAVDDVAERIRQFDTVTDVKSPLSPLNTGQISTDRRSALVQFDILGDSEQAEARVVPIEAAVAQLARQHPGLRIEQFGDASANRALTEAFEDDFRKAETLSLPITLIILVVAFGSLVAAGLPLLLGISAVAIALGLLAPISQLFPVDEAISSVILLVGLAVGVDYSLFYIKRERDERAAGRGKEASLFAAAATSGRAVLVSGTTVMAAMAGMYVTGNATFQSFATGTILVVAVAMVGSVTVLPASLSKLGDNIDRLAVPGLKRRERNIEGGMWAAIVDRVLHRPLISAVAGTAILVFLAIPVLRLHTANSGVQGLPRDLPVMQTYDRIQAAFPGGPLPAVIAVTAEGGVRSGEVAAGVEALRKEAVDTGLMQEPVTITPSPDGSVLMVGVPLVGSGTDDRSNAALEALRDDVVPATLGRVPGVEAQVTGITAQSKDFNDQMKSRAPWVFLFVLSLAFVLLLVTFRSVVIPLKAVVLNLLSVGAAYGVLVWIFQDGNLESLLGFTSIGGITSWLPLFLFVILFGLSMDYHVFILSRVKEGHDQGMSTDEAVSHGIKATASVVTSAAVVMVAVFAVFATLSSIDFKQMGVGLALAVLLDATLVRAVLLPATMKLLGEWNWYLPSWLEWLPRVEAEPAVAVAGAAAGASASGGPAPRLSVVLERGDDGDPGSRIVLAGDLDLETIPRLREEIEAAEALGGPITVDVRKVGFIDSAGLAELVRAHRRARARHERLIVLRGPGTQVAQILAVTRLDETLDGGDGPSSPPAREG